MFRTMDFPNMFLLVWSNLLFHLTQAVSVPQNDTALGNSTAAAAGPGLEGEADKVLIAVAILAGAVIIGAIVAKVVDFIHDRKSLHDDASDMSDYTRDMLKKRYAIMAFKSNVEDPNKPKPDQLALKLGRQWSQKATASRLKRSLSSSRSAIDEKSFQDNNSDVEKGSNTVVELPGIKQQQAGQQPQQNGVAMSIHDVVGTECEIAAENNNLPSAIDKQRIPSLTVDDMDDDVFQVEHTEGNNKTAGSVSIGTLWISEADSVVERSAKVADVQLTPKSAAATPVSSSPVTPKPDAWLYLEDDKDKTTATTSANTTQIDTANEGAASETKAAKRSKLEDELDIPRRPTNPEPPATSPDPISNTPMEKSEDGDWDEGVIYSYDESAKSGNKKKIIASKTVVKTPGSIKTKAQAAGAKIFSIAKRPQTSKRPTTAKSGKSEPVSGRPKTAGAGAGPMKTGNRPVSSKPSRKVAPGVRLKSAKK